MYEDMISWRTDGNELADSERYCKNESHRVELEDNNFYVFSDEHEDRFIGWIHILIIPKIGKWKQGHIFVDEMWVAPKYRRNVGNCGNVIGNILLEVWGIRFWRIKLC